MQIGKCRKCNHIAPIHGDELCEVCYIDEHEEVEDA